MRANIGIIPETTKQNGYFFDKKYANISASKQ